jgi:two-component system NtrC family sensor kinase
LQKGNKTVVINDKKIPSGKSGGIGGSKNSYNPELKKKADEITRKNTQLEIINQLALDTGSGKPFPQIVKNMIPKLKTLVFFHSLTFYLIQKNSLIKRFLFKATARKIKVRETFFQKSKLQKCIQHKKTHPRAVLWTVVHEKKPLFQNNISGETYSFPEDVEQLKQGITSRMLLPLKVGKKVGGILEVTGKNEFCAADLSLLKQIAAPLAVCLEKTRLDQKVRQYRQEWEIIFSAVTDLLVFIDQNQSIQKVNRAALDFFTLSEKDIIGQKCYALFYGRKSRCNPCLADQVLQHNKTVYLQSRTRYNRVLDILAYPACIEGESYQITYYAKDVTRFVDAVKFTSLGEMSAGIAHELNSPLTAIVGNSQLLRRETPPSSPHFQLIKDINSCSARCQRIIQNLLALSRRDEISFEEINLNKVIEKALFLVSYQIEKNKIKLINKITPSPQRIMGNNQGLEQIIINLLLNARDAIEKKNTGDENGAPEIGKVTLSTRMLPEKFIAVDIADNGCGIKAENIPQIFNPFHTSKKPGKGTGLGLSVSLEIAQAHGGFIDVESVPGKGSTFSLILPFQQSGETNDGMKNEDTAADVSTP